MGEGPNEERARAESGGRVVERLVEILGSRLVAVIVGVSQTSTLREWIKGGPPAERLPVLRRALKMASVIEARHDAKTAQSWFQGASHVLGGQSPALALKGLLSVPNRQHAAEAERIESAARTFLDN